jgi:hypothetical protein
LFILVATEIFVVWEGNHECFERREDVVFDVIVAEESVEEGLPHKPETGKFRKSNNEEILKEVVSKIEPGGVDVAYKQKRQISTRV